MMDFNFSVADNKPEGLANLLAMNAAFRTRPWPKPYNATEHALRVGDARDLSWIDQESVHLVVTSPPYFNLKEYRRHEHQMAEIDDYGAFLDALDQVWQQLWRVLVPGGRLCCVVGDVCVPRRKAGRHHVIPLHADILVRGRQLGFDALTPILWTKIANGATEAEGNGAGFYGKPYQPGAIVKNDTEYILFLRKPGSYRSPTPLQKALSMLSTSEMKEWLRSIWTDIRGASTRGGHPAPYPAELAERLIRLFSFAGDVVLDPFVGTGSTTIAAMRAGRNSLGSDVDPNYVAIAYDRAASEAATVRLDRAGSRPSLTPMGKDEGTVAKRARRGRP